MSLDRNRWGFDSEITFTCDECNKEEHTETSSFDSALKHIKEEGWKVKKDGSEWMHFCSPGCLSKYQK